MGERETVIMIKTVVDTIVWMAEERVKGGGDKDLVRAIYAVSMEIDLLVGERMRDETERR